MHFQSISVQWNINKFNIKTRKIEPIIDFTVHTSEFELILNNALPPQEKVSHQKLCNLQQSSWNQASFIVEY